MEPRAGVLSVLPAVVGVVGALARSWGLRLLAVPARAVPRCVLGACWHYSQAPGSRSDGRRGDPIHGTSYLAAGTALRRFSYVVGIAVGPGVLIVAFGALVFGFLACASRWRQSDVDTTADPFAVDGDVPRERPARFRCRRSRSERNGVSS